MKNENEIEIKLTHEEEAFILNLLEEASVTTDDPAERATIEALIQKVRKEIGH